MGYKCIVSLIVGNLYRNMTGISLIYRLSPDIEEDPMKREIDVLSNDNIISLKERIYEKDFINFSDIDAEDLKLWKVQVNNKEGAFSRLVPKNIEGAKKLLKGAINEFWEIQPSKEFTHIIVDSPLLTASKKLKQEEQDENAGDYIIPKSGGKNLKVLYHAEIIRINDVLQIERDYDKIKVMIQCKVTNFDDGILSVILIGHGEKRKEGISSLEDLEEWLLEYSLDYKDRPKKYEKASSHIEIIRNEEWLGSIRERVNYFNKNQDLKKRHKDSAIKSELKQDANLSEELSRLRIIEKEKRPINQAEKLGDREVLPVNNINLFKDLLDASDGLMENYENIPFSYVSPGFVNYTAVLIAVVDLPEDVSVDLPAKFGKYPVLIDYGAFEPAHLTHHSYHRALMPGISISDSEDYNKCTLGVLFKMEEKPGKKFILTVEHGVGCTNDEIIQPSKIDKGTDEHKCARVTQCVCDLKNGFLIDYAFCEVYNREVSVPINMPFESRIIINKYKKDVYNNNDNIYDVQKVGIETSRTDGILRDKLNKVKIRGYPNDNPYALIVYGCDRGGFGKLGDSGSPVFDKDGLLWGFFKVYID